MRARCGWNTLAGAASVVLACLSACARPAPASPGMPSEEDVSSPLADGDLPLSVDASSMKQSLRAPIASIAAVPDSPGWFDVTLAGPDAPETRTLRIASKARLPFTAGDTLDVRWDKRQVGWDAWNVDAEVRDAAGALWVGLYTSMNERDGWAFENLPAADGAPCRVAITHQGHRAVVPTGAWRKFETADGTWAASAECPSSPPGQPGDPPIPDYSPDPTVVTIARLVSP